MERVENVVILTPEEYEKMEKEAEAGRAAAKAPKKPKRKKRNPIKVLHSITAFLFVTSQIAALFWVSISYGIALYATVKLGQPFPVESLSEQAIIVLLGVLGSKVVENIFEHNDGKFLGTSKTDAGAPTDAGGC